MASQNVVQFTDANFDNEVINSETPVLVDFWAEWCGPCRMLAPTIDELAEEYKGKIKVGKVDTDANPKHRHEVLHLGHPHGHRLQERPDRAEASRPSVRKPRTSKPSSTPPAAPPPRPPEPTQPTLRNMAARAPRARRLPFLPHHSPQTPFPRPILKH